MIVGDLMQLMEEIAPLEHAAEWDNVGLLVGSSQWDAASVMLTIDLTEPVLEEAVGHRAGLIVAYHPPVFQPLRRLTDADVTAHLVLRAARAGIAIYSPHTALDAAPAGVNDWLAEAIGSGDVRALHSVTTLPESEQHKIVTFCPADAVDQLRMAMASVGAGRIGDYELCSFEVAGRGTFLGGEETSPTIGEPGRLERVDEVRLEMVCGSESLGLAVLALREFHPYEEPPIEIYRLDPRPQRNTGHGRRILLDQAVALRTLSQRIRTALGVRQLRVATAHNAPRRYRTVGLCSGAGGGFLDEAIAQGCQLYLTGEMRHHDVLSAQARGCTVALAGHTNTERGYLKILRRRLVLASKGAVPIHVSRRDSDPLRVM